MVMVYASTAMQCSECEKDKYLVWLAAKPPISRLIKTGATAANLFLTAHHSKARVNMHQ
jgi:hypothetical protein